MIEAAIVLGIVGLVIGGIWVAASELTARRHTSVLISDVGLALKKLDEFPFGSFDLDSMTQPEILNVLLATGVVDSTYYYDGSYIRSSKFPFTLRFGPQPYNTNNAYLGLAVANSTGSGTLDGGACARLLTGFSLIVQSLNTQQHRAIYTAGPNRQMVYSTGGIAISSSAGVTDALTLSRITCGTAQAVGLFIGRI